jgi:hypothetical protein
MKDSRTSKSCNPKDIFGREREGGREEGRKEGREGGREGGGREEGRKGKTER